MITLIQIIKSLCLKKSFASLCRGVSLARIIPRAMKSVSVSLKTLVICSALLLATPSVASAAVAFGSISAIANAISRTSVTVSGTNPVGVVFVAGDQASDSITSVTWGAGVPMTKIAAVKVSGDRWISAWCVNNPASAATITFNANTDSYWRNFNAYYTGATCPPVDSSNTNTAVAAGISVTTTVVDAGSWLIFFGKNNTGGGVYTPSDSLSVTRADNDAGGLFIGDSNAAVGSGSKTGTMTKTGSVTQSAIAFSLAPYSSAPAASTFQLWSMSSF